MMPTAFGDDGLDALFAGMKRSRGLALAVSGGPDSMALMRLAARWRRIHAPHLPMHVLTVDHRLRAEAADEAAFVAEAATALGLPHATLVWAAPATRNLQARAREARYDLMQARAGVKGLDTLVTAHTRDDQAETVLMRLARGSGVDGLAAMAPRGRWRGLALARPLLDVAKAELMAYLEAESIGWIDDPSNADPRFERVRLRQARDAMGALGLDAAALARTARRMGRARIALEAATDQLLGTSARIDAGGYATLDRPAFLAAPDEIALRALGRLVHIVGGGDAPPRLSRLETLFEALAADGGGCCRTLGGCKILICANDVIGIYREVRTRGRHEIALQPGETALWDGRFSVSLSEMAETPLVAGALTAQGYRHLKRDLDGGCLSEHAAAALPAFRDGDAIAAVPHFGLSRSKGCLGVGDGGKALAMARFVHAP